MFLPATPAAADDALDRGDDDDHEEEDTTTIVNATPAPAPAAGARGRGNTLPRQRQQPRHTNAAANLAAANLPAFPGLPVAAAPDLDDVPDDQLTAVVVSDLDRDGSTQA